MMAMNRNRIRLNESQLHRVIKENINRILKEGTWSQFDDETEKMLDKQNDWAYFDSLRDNSNNNNEFRLEHEFGKAKNGRKQTIANRNSFDHPSIRHFYVNGYLDDSNDIDENTNTKKNRIRLSESQLRQVIKESVKKVLNEIGDTERGQYMLGRAKQRAFHNREDGKEAEISNYGYNQRQKQPNQKKQLYNAYDQGFADQWHKYHNK